jgi:hypothetical protein
MSSRHAWLVFAVVLVASGCAQSRVLGVGDEAAPEVPTEPAKPKQPSRITPKPGEVVGLGNPILGDLDGDGFDDFLIGAIQWDGSGEDSAAHLFYGRKEFPEVLATADAEAVFRTAFELPEPLGDVNGDGLADFKITQDLDGTAAIVLGRRERVRGTQARFSADILWSLRGGAVQFMRVTPAGDVNCDGIDDILVQEERLPQHDEESALALNGTVQSTHLVLGGADLPTGTFDPSWAVAYFEHSRDSIAVPDAVWQPFIPAQAGDLDADGCGDLMVMSVDVMHVFYGDPDRFQGRLDLLNRDASYRFAAGAYPFALRSDFDGDGASDIVLREERAPTLSVAYGPGQRVTGDIEAASSFEVQLADQGSGHPDGATFASGDIDGDRAPDLVIGLPLHGALETSPPTPPSGAMFVIRSTGERAVGTHRLSDGDLLMRGPEPAPVTADVEDFYYSAVGLGVAFSLAGDVDGDGDQDILAGSPSANTYGEVVLIPSAPRAPL